MIFTSINVTILLISISVAFLSVIFYIEMTNPQKVKGLRNYFAGSLLMTTGLLIISLIFLIKNERLNSLLVVAGYLIYIIGLILSSKAIIIIASKKTFRKSFAVINVLVILLVLVSGFFLKDPLIFTITLAFGIIFFYLSQVFVINYKSNTEARKNWYIFSILTTTSVVIIIIYLLERTFNRLVTFDLLNGTKASLLFTLLSISIINGIGLYISCRKVLIIKEDEVSSIFRDITSYSTSILLIFNADTLKIEHVNKLFLNKFNYTYEEIVGVKTFNELFSSKKEFINVSKGVLDNVDVHEYTVRLLKKNSRSMVSIISVRSIELTKDNYLLVNIYDITSTDNERVRLEKLASYDDLTKLPNRRQVLDIFEHKRTIGNPFFIGMMDIDNFKQINDTHGHLMGDEVLKYIARRLRIFNKNKNLVARFGGDEFIFILSASNLKEVRDLSNRLINLFVDPIIIKEKAIKISVSLGVSVFPNDGQTFYELIDKADKSSYHAKQYKNNKVIFYNEDII